MAKIAVIGAGFYGLMIAKFLSPGNQVEIFEEQNDIMTRASSQCQMRIHSGMMYPHNFADALACASSFKLFMLRFKDAIVSDFKSIYAVANDSKISPNEFIAIQKKLHLPVRTIRNEFFDNVTTVFECEEYTFDIDIIKGILSNQNIHFNTHIDSFDELKSYDVIFNCSYSGIPQLLSNSNLRPIDDFHIANTEKIYFSDNIGRTAICVVDGNYFTTMCLPQRYGNLKTVTATDLTTGNYSSNKEKVFERMKYYIPELEVEYSHSTFCPKSTISDTRSVFLRRDGKVFTVLGGKINNVCLLLDFLKNVKLKGL